MSFDFDKERPDWLLTWQNYPHGPLSQEQARRLNRYCVHLEDVLLKAEIENKALREAISPGRMADLDYYVSVAKKMRDRELRIRPMEAKK